MGKDKVVIENLYEVKNLPGKYTNVMLYYRKPGQSGWRKKPIPPTQSAELMGALSIEFKLVEKHPQSPNYGKKIKFGSLYASADANTMWLSSGGSPVHYAGAQITGSFKRSSFLTEVFFHFHGQGPLITSPSSVNVSIGPDSP